MIDESTAEELSLPQSNTPSAPSQLRANPIVTEDDFERVFPEAVRCCSTMYWTPVEVAEAAAAFLAPDPLVRVLDIGSGAGKFCIVGSARTGASFSGIEQRPHLVAIANRAARALRVPRVDFSVGTLQEVPWPCYDAFYFFNPFEENVFQEQGCFDRTVVLSEERFWRDVAFIERTLARAAVGTRVATYHGFGGRIPRSYELVAHRWYGAGVLRFWTKVSAEEGDETIEGGTHEALMPVPIWVPDNADS